jgi:hypothetical protein
MTKEQFIKRMSFIQNFHSEQDTLQVLIDKLTDGYSVVTIGECLVTELLDIIRENLQLGNDDILSWWLYEDVDKVIYDRNGNITHSVRTLDELYDYLVEDKN